MSSIIKFMILFAGCYILASVDWRICVGVGLCLVWLLADIRLGEKEIV